jgi:hypothetical protein
VGAVQHVDGTPERHGKIKSIWEIYGHGSSETRFQRYLGRKTDDRKEKGKEKSEAPQKYE